MATISELQERLRAFSDARDWRQFHSPKNLAMALAGEVGELNALLQWVPEDAVSEWLEDPSHASALRSEIADVLSYLLLLADQVGIDPVAAAVAKVVVNEERYPETLSRGRSSKYNEL